MSAPKSTDEVLRETIYDWLGREFKIIEEQLVALECPQGIANLDGIIWKLSRTLADAGMFEALRKAGGVERSSQS